MTSSVNGIHIKIDDNDSKVLTLMDLAGQENYLVHTLQGLCNYDINYAIV